MTGDGYQMKTVPLLFLELIDEDMELAKQESSGLFTLSYILKRKPEFKHTEDSIGIFQLSNDCIILAVADGFGGQKSGDLASKTAIQELSKILKNSDPSRAREGILDAFESANSLILEKLPGAATTLVVAEVQKEFVRFYHAGDSTGMLLGGGGKLKFRTIDHNPVGYGAEAGLVSGNEKTLEEIGHLVSNYLGSKELRVEVSIELERKPRDRVLLMSDGISDNFNLEKEFPLSDPQVTCSHLCQSATDFSLQDENGKPDDMALIVLGLA